ncbi:hypothetical protein EJA12_00250 [Bhargavaea beijingensis]|uniref:Uncharacterized protein n=1 Tax=Bhargavaea beijingensis TaxID=426756 RepID=A0ABX9ZHC3_9BACL|nr:hypothetical protein EJA12_00250 [Bhargavaea beijingensis]
MALDAGRGFNTPGKRSPDGERQWSFNNKVLKACVARLRQYSGVQILRTDPTGQTDVSLAQRVRMSLHRSITTPLPGSGIAVKVQRFMYLLVQVPNLSALPMPLRLRLHRRWV